MFYKPNVPIAIIEAKNNNYTVSSGIQQALDYAETLDIPFVFSSNGDEFKQIIGRIKNNQNTISEILNELKSLL